MPTSKLATGSTNRGLSLLSMIISILIIGFLVWSLPADYWKMLNPKTRIEKGKKVRDKARDQVWALLGQQAKIAVQTYEAMHGRKPRTSLELRQSGVDLSKKGPWGGKLYIDKKGYLRTTANKKAKYYIW